MIGPAVQEGLSLGEMLMQGHGGVPRRGTLRCHIVVPLSLRDEREFKDIYGRFIGH